MGYPASFGDVEAVEFADGFLACIGFFKFVDKVGEVDGVDLAFLLLLDEVLVVFGNFVVEDDPFDGLYVAGECCMEEALFEALVAFVCVFEGGSPVQVFFELLD